MSYKTILAVIGAPGDLDRAGVCAARLAARFDAHLIGIHAEALPVPIAAPAGFPDAGLVTAGIEINRERSAAIRERFEAMAAREAVAHEWQDMENISGDSAVAAIAVARSCDLVVAQQNDPEAGAGAAANLEALLFETGRPVLLVPYAAAVDTRFRKVLVAWNGSAQAARAAFDALPFITAADETELLSLDAHDDSRQDSAVAGADIAAALARHGARVTFAASRAGGVPPGEAIENRAVETGAELVVMGAYSQSWLRQMLFGGATRTLLRSMPVATLMSR